MRPVDEFEIIPRFVTTNTLFGITSHATLTVQCEQVFLMPTESKSMRQFTPLHAGFKDHFSLFIVSEGIPSIIAFLTPVTVN